MDGFGGTGHLAVIEWSELAVELWLWHLDLLKNFLSKCECGQIGNPDFVATMVALVLAAEFWDPLKKFTRGFLREVELRPTEIKNQIQLSRLDADTKAVLISDFEDCSRDLMDCSERNRIIITSFSRWSSIASAGIGMGLLYFGIISCWNILLALPIVVFIVWSGILYHYLNRSVGRVSKMVAEKLNRHVFEGESLAIDLPKSSDQP